MRCKSDINDGYISVLFDSGGVHDREYLDRPSSEIVGQELFEFLQTTCARQRIGANEVSRRYSTLSFAQTYKNHVRYKKELSQLAFSKLLKTRSTYKCFHGSHF